MPLDGGHLILSDEEKDLFVKTEPRSLKYIKPLISAYEFINGKKRWCIWLLDIAPNELKSMPEVLKRVELVKKLRLASVAASTKRFADVPTLFRDKNQPNMFLVIPRVSLEGRAYIPIGFLIITL